MTRSAQQSVGMDLRRRRPVIGLTGTELSDWLDLPTP